MRVRIEGVERKPSSKGDVKKLRAQGLVPTTLSGKGTETLHLSLPAKELDNVLRHHGMAAVVELVSPAASCLAITRSIQRDPLTNGILNIEFRRLAESEPVTAAVAVVLAGEPDATRSGEAVLEVEASTLEVRALPQFLPEHVTVDVSGMVVGQALHVSDLPSNEQYEILSAPDTVVATIHSSRLAVAEAEQAVEEPAPAEAEA